MVVNNIGTMAALADYFDTGLPLIERVLTVAGPAVDTPANLLVPIGTPVREVLDFCGGLKEDTKEVILGGPMMGQPTSSLDVPDHEGKFRHTGFHRNRDGAAEGIRLCQVRSLCRGMPVFSQPVLARSALESSQIRGCRRGLRHGLHGVRVLHLCLPIQHSPGPTDPGGKDGNSKEGAQRMKPDYKLLIQSAPHLRQGLTTPQLMMDVVYALVPVTLAAVWLFGLSAVFVLTAAIAGAVATEWIFSPKAGRGRSLLDATAVLTGLLLGLTLPPAIPLWMAFLGGAVSIGLGKLIWGGLGQNLFNPALVGRAFIQAAFPTAITTWTAQGGPAQFFKIHMSNFALPLMQPQVDIVTSATPLNLMKFQQEATPLTELVVGNTAGSLGETSAMLILIGGAYLWLRRSYDWRIPVSILIAAAALSGALYAMNPSLYPSPWFTIFSGSLLFGAIYMATDPVTSPLAPKGAWIFGIGIGVLVVLIRVFGGLPEGVMYAILLMNSASPLIERWTQPRVFGRGGKAT